MRQLIALLFSATALMAACSGPVTSPEESFADSHREFHNHLRWARYHEASAFVEVADREAFLGYYDELGDDYEITEFEVRGVTYDAEAHTAVIEVWIQSFRLPSTRVNEEVVEEEWAFNLETHRWEVLSRESDPED